MAGLLIGIVRMILDFIYEAPGCGIEDTRPAWAVAILVHYMYFALFLFCWTFIWTIIISLLTPPIPSEYVSIRNTNIWFDKYPYYRSEPSSPMLNYNPTP